MDFMISSAKLVIETWSYLGKPTDAAVASWIFCYNLGRCANQQFVRGIWWRCQWFLMIFWSSIPNGDCFGEGWRHPVWHQFVVWNWNQSVSSFFAKAWEIFRHCLDPCFFLEVLHPLEVNAALYTCANMCTMYIYMCVCNMTYIYTFYIEAQSMYIYTHTCTIYTIKVLCTFGAFSTIF